MKSYGQLHANKLENLDDKLKKKPTKTQLLKLTQEIPKEYTHIHTKTIRANKRV